ncbi:MAG: UvrD-helicase domain-containing protein [[Clostridium] leptum]
MQRQQILLNRAHISTIHSFAAWLVRENFYKLGISPDFRILEENETLLLRQEVITVLDGYYEKRDGLFMSWRTPFR